jgi:hypothetical protein
MRKLLRARPKKAAAKPAPASVRTKARANGKANVKANGRTAVRGNYA